MNRIRQSRLLEMLGPDVIAQLPKKVMYRGLQVSVRDGVVALPGLEAADSGNSPDQEVS